MEDIYDRLVLKGTTTIGVVCKDGVILSSDTRVTMGYFVAHKKGKKIYKIDDHLAMTISGGVADAQKAVEILRVNSKLYRLYHKRPFPVRSASVLLSNVLFDSRPYPLLTQVIVGGIDDTGSRVFSVDPFGSVTEEKCVATGSGSPIAYGVLEDKYREDVSIHEMLPVVVKAIKSAMSRDTASGDSFDVSVIDENGYRELTDEEKNRIIEG
ncbi:MAG TPA: archaeal proteasome endopeptidase complex subunit beta [Candidatus Bathyarchaeota archaeon]|nr:archaeal proteasome endopeptidase complex subunit beta [Candidatus Bathyarchaeota archaeon]